MDRQTLRYAVVALLGGVAVALAAATFPTTRRTGTTGTESGESGAGTLPIPTPEEEPTTAVEPPPLITEVMSVLVAIMALALLVYCILYWREALRRILEGVIIGGFMFLLLQLIIRFFSVDRGEGEVGIGDDPTFGIGGEGGDTLVSTDPSSLSVLFVLLFGILIVGLAAVLTQKPDDDEDESKEQAAADADTVAAVGRAAGRAADRIAESDEHENEIYRAWAEMARQVRPSDPETKTPAEFADAAIEAGMEPADVRELTRLFEQVRYGTDEPSEADEQRAIGLLRRLESTYTEEET